MKSLKLSGDEVEFRDLRGKSGGVLGLRVTHDCGCGAYGKTFYYIKDEEAVALKEFLEKYLSRRTPDGIPV